MNETKHVRGYWWCLLLLFLSGCTAHTASDAGDRFHYAWWVWAGMIALGIVLVPIGFALRSSEKRSLAWSLIIVGPLAVVILAPSYFLEQVTVSDTGCEVRSGMWGMNASESVRFDAASKLRIVEESVGRRARRIEVFCFDLKAGGEVRIPLNNDVKVLAGPEIIRRASAAGLAVEGAK